MMGEVYVRLGEEAGRTRVVAETKMTVVTSHTAAKLSDCEVLDGEGKEREEVQHATC
jgi:hypothetical protein